jgi:hypothetical protein
MDALIDDALAWSARLGWPLTRHEALALAALALVALLVTVRLLVKARQWRRRNLCGREHSCARWDTRCA